MDKKTNQQLTKDFRQSLQRLNSRQRDAVEHLEGPLMVIAGPGTGKTEILGARIGQILLQTDTDPSNILCLTFTEAGTFAMRERLIKFIGADAHNIPIHTFHSFCNKVIQELPEKFKRYDLDAISDLEQIELMDELVSSLPLDSPLIKLKSDNTYLRSNLTRLFSFMKREDLNPSEVETKVDKRIKEIYEGDEFRYKRASGENKAGDLKRHEIRKVEDRLHQLKAAAGLYSSYQELMLKNGRYDFDDMILWVIDLFERDEDVLRSYQEQFQYVLVDEYQDTNGSQNHLLMQLIDFWSEPNVMVVGDDDQSIFRFQGAQVENIVNFHKKFSPGLKEVVLDQNYRSTSPILHAAGALIKNNDERLVHHIDNLEKDLHSNSDLFIEKIKVIDAYNPIHEACFVGNEITRRIRDGEEAESIAVIYRKHKQVDELARFLNKEGIPVYLKKRENVLEQENVRFVVQLLTWLAQESHIPFSGDHLLFTILHHRSFELKPLLIARFSSWVYRHGERRSWRELLSADHQLLSEMQGAFSTPELEQMHRASDLLDSVFKNAQSLTMQELLERIYRDFGLIDHVVRTSNVFELECLRTFMDFVKDETSRSPLSIEELLTKLDLMEKHGLQLTKERLLYDEKGVNLMTAHGSKGLEYRTVFVIGCEQKHWDKEPRRAMPFGLDQILTVKVEGSNVEESRRLFYVALTRAEQNLYLCHSRQDLNEKPRSRTRFIDEIAETQQDLLQELTFEESNEGILQWMHSAYQVDTKDAMAYPIFRAPFIHENLQTYVLSVTHLSNYLECPTAFFFQHVLRVPAAKNKYMSYGTAIHNAVEDIQKKLRDDASNCTSEYMISQFESAMLRERSNFTRDEFEKFSELGRQEIVTFVEARRTQWLNEPRFETEVSISDTEYEGVPIKGKIDRLVQSEREWIVTDFKTGSYRNAKKKLVPPLEKATSDDPYDKVHGGNYWRQIVFYSLLLRSAKYRQIPMHRGIMDFVESDDDGNHVMETIEVDIDAQRIVGEQLKMAYEGIMAKHFSPGCGKPDCEWCSLMEKHDAEFRSEL